MNHCRQTIRGDKTIPAIQMRTLALLGALAMSLGTARAQGEDREFNPRKVLGPLPAITDFPVKPVAEVGEALNPSELVLAVTIGKESRAYPINMLTGPRREILNDTLGGRAIAATW